jgi:acetyl-CoA synthetase (ADP-forming)
MKTLLDRWRAGLTVADRPDEYEVKHLLAGLGLHVPPGMRLPPGNIEARPDFPGPYVAKVCSPYIEHKTDLQGVHLNLNGQRLSAALRILKNAFPEASILIEAMVTFDGPEMIAGGVMDPGFGPAVMVGAGGILTEIAPDVAFRLAPLAEPEARRMLLELAIYPVFEGFRGLKLDPAALAQLMVVVSQLVDALGSRFDQLDLNPIVWGPAGWTILDAKLMLRRALSPPCD